MSFVSTRAPACQVHGAVVHGHLAQPRTDVKTLDRALISCPWFRFLAFSQVVDVLRCRAASSSAMEEHMNRLARCAVHTDAVAIR